MDSAQPVILYFIVVGLRKLFETGLRNPVCQIDGILSDPDLYTKRADRHHIVGELLAEQMCNARPSVVGCHHCVDHDHSHVVD